MNILEILVRRAEENPEKPAYIYLEDGELTERILTFGQLKAGAKNIGAHLISRSEQACILLFPPGLNFVEAFWGCMWAGKMAVPVSFPVRRRGFEPLARLIADVGEVTLLTDNISFEKLRQWFGSHPGFEKIKWLLIEDLKSPSPAVPPTMCNGNDIAILQYTSGSTGHPKGVMVSHDNVMHNAAFIQKTFGLTPDTLGVTWLPHFHDMGLIDGFVEPVFSGFTRVFMSPLHFVQKPARWLQAISRYGAHYSGAPNFAYDLCAVQITDEQLESIDLTKLAYLYSGAETVHYHTLINFSRRFESHGYQPEKLVTCYGMAETTLAICFSPTGKAPFTIGLDGDQYKNGVIVALPNSNLVKVSSGIAPEDVHVKIVNPSTLVELGDMEVGEIWTQSPSVCQGYWKKKDETHQFFHAQIKDDTGRYLQTGDLGFISNGALFITGRLKDLIIYHGINYHPDDLEASIGDVAQLRGMSRAAFSIENKGVEQIVIVTEIRRSSLQNLDVDALISTIKKIIFTNFSLPVSEIVVVNPKSLPKSTSGKIQRMKCKKLYLDGQLNNMNTL